MKKVFRKFAMLSVAMLLAFAGCEKDPGSENDNSNNGGGDTGNVSGTIAGHDYVDLGLPSGLKWATCNVGASKPHNYGNYYAWARVTTDNYYGGANLNAPTFDISGKQSYDVARSTWKSTWRMPTHAEMNELKTRCTWKWSTQNGINGYTITGSNGNSIFLPASGYIVESNGPHGVGESGSYWDSTPWWVEDPIGHTIPSAEERYGGMLSISKNEIKLGYGMTGCGRSIRPVSD